MLSSLIENFSLWHLVRELGVTHSSFLRKENLETIKNQQFIANRVIVWNCLPDYVDSTPLNSNSFKARLNEDGKTYRTWI